MPRETVEVQSMPLVPADALTKKLTWGNFKPRKLPAPAPGVTATAAETLATIIPSPRRLNFNPVKGTSPVQYQMVEKPNVTVSFTAESWKASFIATFPQSTQDALLAHEQLHYLIMAVFARDLANELTALQKKTFQAPEDGISELDDIWLRFSSVEGQRIQDKYDGDTKHDPVAYATEQKKWRDAVEEALNKNQPLMDFLTKAKLMP